MKKIIQTKKWPSGVTDRNGAMIHEGEYVKVHIGKPNNGYLVQFIDGAFCLTGRSARR